mgnify:FL=1
MSKIKITGPWDMQKIGSYLDTSVVPLKLAIISARGWPVIASLWFSYEDGTIICASKEKSRVIQILKENNKCAFEVSADSPPYHGVRGQGLAVLGHDPSGKTLENLHDRFLGSSKTPFKAWLMRGASEEVIIRITPSNLMSWDYRNRMDKECKDA